MCLPEIITLEFNSELEVDSVELLDDKEVEEEEVKGEESVEVEGEKLDWEPEVDLATMLDAAELVDVESDAAKLVKLELETEIDDVEFDSKVDKLSEVVPFGT